MTLKIERKPLHPTKHQRTSEWGDFLEAVKACKVGESFVSSECPSNYRLALSIAQIWLGANFRTVREGDGFRIGRIG